MEKKAALLMVDIQNDFCAGGSLAVPQANEIIEMNNHLQTYFDQIIATKDWHPTNHVSFARCHPGLKVGDITQDSQVVFPDHCVQGTKGADFPPALHTDRINKVIYKGMDPNIDSYSAFFDNTHQHATQLEAYLRAEGIETLYIAGLTIEYCVRYSVLDALQLGFKVYVIQDACRGLVAEDSRQAWEEMRQAGAKMIDSKDMLLSK